MLPVKDAQVRERVLRRFLYLQIYHRLHCAWWNWTLPSTTFAKSATVVVALYVGLRITELPWYLYWIYWLAGFGLLLQIFGNGYNIVCAKEDSDDVVEKLQSPASVDLEALSVEGKKKILKRSKAIHGLKFRIASFAEYSWAVPLAAWDEILNQLFFLLSL